MTPLCPACGAAHEPGDRFCADCGTALGVPQVAACPNCGGQGLDSDGFCTDCGARARDAGAGLVVCGAGLAAGTDAGRRHTENQDAVALGGPGRGGAGCIAVVCDGVSNSQTPAAAAAAAVQAAFAVLEAAGADVGTATMRAAVVAAHAAVCGLPYDRQADVDPPACTLVAAAVRWEGDGFSAVLGWLGDSRAYAVSDTAAALLTHDHSWVNLVVDAGTMPLAEAQRDRRAHALVQCLGTTDFTALTPCPEPAVRTVGLPAGGWLVLCSDGLWNYADAPAALQRAGAEGWGGEAGPLCSVLLHHALAGGGHDNVTVAAIRLGPGVPP